MTHKEAKGAVLYLPLKAEYFDAIKAGTKTEEYRIVSPYWRRRLQDGFHGITHVELMRGYPRAEDAARRLRRPWQGYTLKTITHPHFGPEPVSVFAIKVGPASSLTGGKE